MNTSKCRRGVAAAFAAALTVACADAVAPSLATETTVPSEPQSRDQVLGGDAAVRAVEAMLEQGEREGRPDHELRPLRALVRATRQPAVVPAQPSFLVEGDETLSGPYEINGETYVESGGEFYPPAGRKAVILQQHTYGILEPNRASVTAWFQYEGHDGTQTTEWEVRNPVTGETIRRQPSTTFGSRATMLLGYVKFFTGSISISNLPPCNTQLTGSSQHKAWYNGWWEVSNEGSAGSGWIFGIKLVRAQNGVALGSSGIQSPPKILCPDPLLPEPCLDEGGEDPTDDLPDVSSSPTGSARLACDDDGGGFDDDGGCTICQQWFWVVDGIITDEWWECWYSIDVAECESLMM